VQPLTRGPEADETKTRDSDTATPRPGVTVKAAAAPSSAFDLCADALGVRSSPLGADTVCKSRNSFADALFSLHARAGGLGAVDHLLCEGAVCTRVRGDRVLRRCHAAPKRCGSELEL
jgi:hypothetical protein